MKKPFYFILFSILIISGCSSKKDDPVRTSSPNIPVYLSWKNTLYTNINGQNSFNKGGFLGKTDDSYGKVYQIKGRS
ncbi:hypothetical protein [Paenibacillus humicola]|uniref:hypothetical protein n=1 Tax=Paenibacillus humicola TaxID=3110540 RepID=UPI00237A6641|nr:hypothetical protein [Paenibacillus humicola]